MRSLKYFIIGIGILTLAPVVTPIYNFFQRENDGSVQFVGVQEGNPRLTYKFREVTSRESEALKKSMRENCPDLVRFGKISAYFEVFDGEFNLNLEGVSSQEASGIVKKIVNGSGLNVDNFNPHKSF